MGLQNYFEASSYIDKVSLVLSVGFIICSSLLLAGIRKQEPKFVFPMVAFLPIDILARLGIIITYSAIIGFLHPLTIVVNVMFVAGLSLDFSPGSASTPIIKSLKILLFKRV